MDWPYVLFAVNQGIPALITLAICFPVFAFAATANRKLWATSPTIAAFFGFGIAFLAAGVPGVETSTVAAYFPLAVLVATVVLVAPSVWALRHRWLGLLHLLTVAAAGYLWFVASLAISHDGT